MEISVAFYLPRRAKFKVSTYLVLVKKFYFADFLYLIFSEKYLFYI